MSLTGSPSTSHPASARSRERGRDRAEQAPVGVGELGSIDLAAQHSELVAQHDDLEVLRAAATHRQPCQQREEPVKDATHEAPGWSA